MKDFINIEEVCAIAKVSKPTVYRRVKLGTFPKPKKVPRTANRGPKTVNQWDRAEVIGWLLKGNDPKWLHQPVKDIKEVCAKIDNVPITHEELATALEPGLNALFGEHQQSPDEITRRHDGAHDLYDFDPVEEPSKTKRYMAQAVVAALLAGILVMLFT